MINIVRKALIVASGTGAAQVISFVALPFLSRLYGPENFGDFAVFSSVCWIIAVFATLQLEHAIILPKSSIGALRLVHVVVIVGAVTAAVSALVLFLIACLTREVLPDLPPLATAALAALIVFSIAVTQALRAWLVRAGRFSTMAKGAALTALATAATAIVPAYFLGHSYLGYGLVLAQGLGVFAAAAYWSREVNWRRLSTLSRRQFLRFWATIKKHRGFAATLTISNATKTGYGRLPTVTVAAIGGATSAGYFGLVERVISAPSVLLAQALGSAYRHHVSAAAARNDHAAVLKEYWRMIGLAAALAVPVFLIGILLAPWAFGWLFGPDWVQAGHYASIVLIGEAFVFVLMTVEDTAVLLRRNRYRLFWHLAQMGCAVLLFALATLKSFANVEVYLWAFVVYRIAFSLVDLWYFRPSITRRPRAAESNS